MPKKLSRLNPWPRELWEWFGQAGHFICGRDCQFHLATRVGPWWVSTVGEYLPDSTSWDSLAQHLKGETLEGRGDFRRADFLKKVGYVEIGCGRLYETMVFKVGSDTCEIEGCTCEGQPEIQSYSELDSDAYNDARSARDGHIRMCEKWAQIDPSNTDAVENAWRDEVEA